MLTFFSILSKVNIMKNMHHLKYACRFDLLGNSFCCVVSYLCSGNFWGFPWKTPRKGSSFWEVATQHFFEFFKHFQTSFSVEHLWEHLCIHHYVQYASVCFPVTLVFPYSVYAKIRVKEYWYSRIFDAVCIYILNSFKFFLGSFLDRYKVFLPNLVLCIGFLLSAFFFMLVTSSRLVK